MDISIIILHHNSPEEVGANLNALELACLPEKTEVIVINNGGQNGNDAIEMRASKKFELKFFEIENRGYPQGNNFGLKMARGKFLCILNPDIVVEKNTFKNLIEYLNSHSRVGIAAPRLVYPDGKIQDNYRVFPRVFDLVIKRTFPKLFRHRMRCYLMWDKDPLGSESVDWLTGAFQIFTRKCWENVGPNDECYFLFMSDVDICRNAWEHNFEVHFVGNAEALHNESRLSDGGVLDIFRKKTLRIHLLDALKYYKKYMGKPLPAKCPSKNRAIVQWQYSGLQNR